MSIRIELKDLAATEQLGQNLADLVSIGDVVSLMGDLGAGKTSLTRGLIKALAPDVEDVQSPTFTLVQTYEASVGTIRHFDLYRLEVAEEVFELGLEESEDGISLIEWPDKAGQYLPEDRIEIRLDYHGDGRVAEISATTTEMEKRLHDRFTG